MTPFALNIHETDPDMVDALLLLLDNRHYLCVRDQRPEDHLLMVNFNHPKSYSYSDTRYVGREYLLLVPQELDEIFDRLNEGHTFLLTDGKP